MRRLFLCILSLTFCKFKGQSNKCCPRDKLSREQREADLGCDRKNNKYYHCMQRGNGSHAEFCAQRTIISLGKCPMSEKGNGIDHHFECRAKDDTGCPNGQAFFSDELYRYPGCTLPCVPDSTFTDAFSTESAGSVSGNNLQISVRTSTISYVEGFSRKERNTVYTVLLNKKADIDDSQASVSFDKTTIMVVSVIGGTMFLFTVVTCVSTLKVRREMAMRRPERQAVELQAIPFSHEPENEMQSSVTMSIVDENIYDYPYPECSSGPSRIIITDNSKSRSALSYESPVIRNKYESLQALEVRQEALSYEYPVNRNKYESLEALHARNQAQRSGKLYDSVKYNDEETPNLTLHDQKLKRPASI